MSKCTAVKNYVFDPAQNFCLYLSYCSSGNTRPQQLLNDSLVRVSKLIPMDTIWFLTFKISEVFSKNEYIFLWKTFKTDKKDQTSTCIFTYNTKQSKVQFKNTSHCEPVTLIYGIICGWLHRGASVFAILMLIIKLPLNSG